MIMLFFSFLGISFSLKELTLKHLKIALINVFLPILLFLAIRPFNLSWAYIAFVLSIVPTAVAATVIAEIMKKRVDFVTFSILLTCPLIALVLPFLFESTQKPSVLAILLPIAVLIFVPLICSQFLRSYFRPLTNKLLMIKEVTFPLFLGNIIIACGNAAHFIQQNEAIGISQLLPIFILASCVCSLHFVIGKWVGGKELGMEYSLSLGRKNTMIGLWLSLTYFDPLIALGPICYIVAQNIYNSIQIWQLEANE